MHLFLLLALFGLMHAVRSFAPQMTLGTSAAAVTLAGGFLLLTALFAGNLFARLHLPRLTGYLVLGMLVGPDVTNLVSEQSLVQLRVFNGVATALIALTAGIEMDFRSMRPLLRGIAWIAVLAVAGTAVLLAVTVYAVSDGLAFTAGFTTAQLVAVAAVLGVTMASQSPAVVVALSKELRADGPVSRTVLGVVVVSDLGILVLFALTTSIARELFTETVPGVVAGGSLLWEIFGSGALGVLIGVLVAAFLRRVAAGGALFIVTVGFLVAEVGHRVDLDPLLMALVAGILIRNATRHGDRLRDDIASAALPVYVAFFAVAGATIHLDLLPELGALAALFAGVRVVGLLVGTRLATRLAGSDAKVARFAGFGLLPQAGLSLALAALLGQSFPGFGLGASALVFGVVAMNEMLAPIIYRWALVRSGESPVSGPAPVFETTGSTGGVSS